MIRGLYSAATAVGAASQQQEAIAGNLAHAVTPGYRRTSVRIETFEEELNQAQQQNNRPVSLSGSQVGDVYTIFEEGALVPTDNPLDVAIVGNAFFAVDGPEGPLLTRNGSFRLNEKNQLKTQNGFLVRGQGGGPITIPLNQGQITITQEGRILANNQAVGQLELVKVNNLQQLERFGPLYFQGADTSNQATLQDARVEQGYLESSNVKVVNDLVSMMLGLRQYQAANRAMRTIADTLALRTRPES